MEIKPTSTGDRKQSRRDFLLVGGVLLLLVGALVAIYQVAMPRIEDLMARPEPEPASKDELEVAAERGEAWAQHRLAVQLSTGTDRKKNAPQAAEWFRKAAHQNHADAQYELGLLFETGEGVTANLPEAYYWVLLSDLNSNQLAKAKLLSLAARLTFGERANAERRAEQEIALRQPFDSNATAPAGN